MVGDSVDGSGLLGRGDVCCGGPRSWRSLNKRRQTDLPHWMKSFLLPVGHLPFAGAWSGSHELLAGFGVDQYTNVIFDTRALLPPHPCMVTSSTPVGDTVVARQTGGKRISYAA